MPVNHLKKWLPQLNNSNAQNEYYLTDVVQMAVQDGVGIHTVVPSSISEVLGVNNQAQLVASERLYQLKQANHLLDMGVLVLDPNRFDLRGALSAGRDVVIDVNVILEGQVDLGDGVKIGPNCVLKNCKIGSQVEILSHCHLEDVVIHDGAVVGPFARLRPGTQLGAKSRVGNFVEIKNAKIGANTKVNHLTYVGDAMLGKNVNIGAGTITCNYDGAFKHQTIIKDGVHIGSNCELVAPLTIGEGATVAAGSTVTKDVPAYKLTLTHRLEHRSIVWERPKKEKSQGSESLEKKRG